MAATLTIQAGTGINIPKPEKIKLENGVTVFYHYDSTVPLVSLRLFLVGAGTAYEPKGKEGISDFTATMLTKGTTKMTADQISGELDYMGASLFIGADSEYLFANGTCLKEYFPKLLDITTASVLNPVFREEEIAKEKAKRLESMKSIKDSAYRSLFYYINKAYFKNHPMGNLDIGSVEFLKSVSSDVIKSYYNEYYRPDRMMISVVGDVKKADLVKMLEDKFGAWKASAEKPALAVPEFPAVEGRTVYLVDKPDGNQTYWILSAPGYKKGADLEPQAEIIRTLFGGRFTSWLNSELRIKRGLTYGARCAFNQWKDDGTFVAYSYTQNKNIGLMLDLVFEMLKKAKTEGFSKEEIRSAKNYILGQFPPRFQTMQSKGRVFTDLTFYNLGFDYYSKFLGGVESATDAAVNEAAKKLLPLDEYVLVVIGKADEIRPALKKYGKIIEKKVTDPGFEF